MVRTCEMRKFLILIGLILLAGFEGRAKTELGIEGERFTVNGAPVFLLGISYYGALGAPDDFVRQDLDEMKRNGFDWIRVWADWTAFGNDISAVDAAGATREPYLSKLEHLIRECNQRGMIVDVTLAREKDRLRNLPEHRRAVESLVERLKAYRNWYLDLGNERNIGDARFVSFDDLKVLRDRAKELDGKRLITASHSSDDQDLMKHLEDYLKKVQVDFIAVHRGRYKGTAEETEGMTGRVLKKMREMGVPAPLLYQEPFRRGYTAWEPTEADFYKDLEGAIKGEAAGWCFHNGAQKNGTAPKRSFDLREKRLFEQLDEVELKVMRGAGRTKREE